MGERIEAVVMARIFGAISVGVAAMILVAEIGHRYGAMAFSAALAVVGVILFGAASFLDRPAATPKGGD